MLQVQPENQTRILRVTQTAADRAKRLLLNRKIDVNQIVIARNLVGFHRRCFEKAQPLQPDAGLLDGRRRGGGGLHLTHFPAQHVIHGGHVARKIDASNVGALAGIDKEFHNHRAVFFVDLGHASDLGKIVALVTETASQVILGGGHQLLGIDLLGLHDQETIEIFLGQHEITA